MKISRITVGFSETCNLGDYSNTKPSIELTADLETGDDVLEVIDHLTTLANQTLHKHIDEELERVGKSPKYYDGPLYSVYSSYKYNYILIVPSEPDRHVSHETYYATRQRYEIARAKAEELASGQDRLLFDGLSPELLAYFEAAEAKYKQAEEERRFQEEKKRQEWLKHIKREQEEAEEEEEKEEFDDEEDEESDDNE